LRTNCYPHFIYYPESAISKLTDAFYIVFIVCASVVLSRFHCSNSPFWIGHINNDSGVWSIVQINSDSLSSNCSVPKLLPSLSIVCPRIDEPRNRSARAPKQRWSETLVSSVNTNNLLFLESNNALQRPDPVTSEHLDSHIIPDCLNGYHIFPLS